VAIDRHSLFLLLSKPLESRESNRFRRAIVNNVLT
jgi:hypothetical protein